MGLQAVCRDCQVPMEIQAVWISPGLPIVFIRKKKQQIHLVKWHPLFMQKNIKFAKILSLITKTSHILLQTQEVKYLRILTT